MNRPKKITLVNRMVRNAKLTLNEIEYTFVGEGDSNIVPYSTDTSAIGDMYSVSSVDDYDFATLGATVIGDGLTPAEVIGAKGGKALFDATGINNTIGNYLKKYARGFILCHTGAATADKIITIGTNTNELVFTFKASGTAALTIVVNADLATQAANIANAINANTSCVVSAIVIGNGVLLVSKVIGIAGNSQVFTTNEPNLTITGSGTLTNGTA